MSPDSIDPLGAKLTTAFRARVLQAAIRDGQQVDPRTITAAQRYGILRRNAKVHFPDAATAVLADRRSPNRAAAPRGPLLFHTTGQVGRSVAVIPQILLSASRKARRDALEYLEEWAADDPNAMTPKTRRAIDKRRTAVVANRPLEWREAAIDVFDALEDDFLCSLAGLRQALTMGFAQGAEDYAHRVFVPTVSSLDSIDLRFWQPGSQLKEIRAELLRIGRHEHVVERFTAFYEALGHLPLDRSFGLAAMLPDGPGGGSDLARFWEGVWTAADQIGSPLARYHACCLFIERPELVPDAHRAALWREIMYVALAADGRASDDLQSRLWIRRSTLGRHYFQHLACHLPGSHSERLAAFAWWAADRVESVVLVGGSLSDRLSETVLAPAIAASAAAFTLAQPPVDPSLSGYLLSHVPSPWAIALQCQLAGDVGRLIDPSWLERIGTGAVAAEEDAAQASDGKGLSDPVGTALVFGTMSVSAWPSDTAGPPVLGFDRSLDAAAEAWAGVTPSDQMRRFLGVLTPAVRELRSEAELTSAIRRLPETNEHERILILAAFRSSSEAGTLGGDELLGLLTDPVWREGVLQRFGMEELEVVAEAFRRSAAGWGDQLRWQVPHFWAMECESAIVPERRELLFAQTVALCVCTGTDSAIRRLLKGPVRGELHTATQALRSRFNELITCVSPWAGSRIRACLGALGII